MASQAVSGVFLLLGGALRWVGWLNGLASLLLMAFSMGIVGGELAPPDLTWPLSFFLAGLLSTALAFLLFALLRAIAPGEGRRLSLWFFLVLVLALLAYAAAIAGFAGGCWLSLGAGPGADTGDVYAAA